MHKSYTSTNAEPGSVTKRPVKTNGYSSSKLWAKREARRVKADELTEKYQALSLNDKIKLVKSRRGESKKEMARLMTLKSAAKKE